jgi:hypothetical protein
MLARTPAPSTTATGTASPNSASQASAGRRKSVISTGAGRKTSVPTTSAVTTERRVGCASSVITDAATYDAVSSGAAIQRSATWVQIDRPVISWPVTARLRPSGNAAQKRRA